MLLYILALVCEQTIYSLSPLPLIQARPIYHVAHSDHFNSALLLVTH